MTVIANPLEQSGRSKSGHKKSSWHHNLEERSEGDLKRQTFLDKAPCKYYKKRHRKDLTADEVDAIVAAAGQPYRLQRDVAQQFRVTTNLVSRLVVEAERKPEKQTKKRDLKRRADEKHDAI